MVFIELRDFTAGLQRLPRAVADDVPIGIQSDLLTDPHRGDVVPGLGGIRKARVADPSRGKGKRGGFRYMYFYVQVRGRFPDVYLQQRRASRHK